MRAIILAGGKGTRLAPYTTILPKPLMPIGNMPIVEIVIRQLAYYGIKDITLAVGYLAELLMAYCGDGSKFNVSLSYSREAEPYGTAGPIGLVSNLNQTFLVMNGDLLTTLDYRELWENHKRRGAIATLAAFRRVIDIDLGVVETNQDNWVASYSEKPSYSYKVSTGIYLFEPQVLDYIGKEKHLDLPDLILDLLKHDKPVNVYEFDGYWLDIGRHDDYELAIQEFTRNRKSFLREDG